MIQLIILYFKKFNSSSWPRIFHSLANLRVHNTEFRLKILSFIVYSWKPSTIYHRLVLLGFSFHEIWLNEVEKMVEIRNARAWEKRMNNSWSLIEYREDWGCHMVHGIRHCCDSLNNGIGCHQKNNSQFKITTQNHILQMRWNSI